MFFNVVFIVLEVGQTLQIGACIDDNGVPVYIHEVWQFVENLGHYLQLKHSLISASRTLRHRVPVLSITLGHPEWLNKIIVSELSRREVSQDLVLILAHHIIEQFVGFGHFGILVLQEVQFLLFILFLLLFILFFKLFINLSLFFVFIEILEQLFDAFFLFRSMPIIGNGKKVIHKIAILIIFAVTIFNLLLHVLVTETLRCPSGPHQGCLERHQPPHQYREQIYPRSNVPFADTSALIGQKLFCRLSVL